MSTMELGDGVTQRGKRAADLAVAAFVHGYFPIGAIRIGETFKAEFARAVFELDAVIADHLLVQRCEVVIKSYLVDLGFIKLRVGHLVGKITVVGQE